MGIGVFVWETEQASLRRWELRRMGGRRLQDKWKGPEWKHPCPVNSKGNRGAGVQRTRWRGGRWGHGDKRPAEAALAGHLQRCWLYSGGLEAWWGKWGAILPWVLCVLMELWAVWCRQEDTKSSWTPCPAVPVLTTRCCPVRPAPATSWLPVISQAF